MLGEIAPFQELLLY